MPFCGLPAVYISGTCLNLVYLFFREWYGYHFPELVKIVNDNYMYARVAKLVGNRKIFTTEKLEELEEVVMDSAKAKAIHDASKSSMGKFELDLFLNTHAFKFHLVLKGLPLAFLVLSKGQSNTSRK